MTIDSSAIESPFEDVDDTVLEPAPTAATTAIAPAAPLAATPDTPPAAGEEPADRLPTAPVRDAGGSNAVWWTLGGALVVIGGLFVARRRKPEDEDIVAKLAARAPSPTRQLADDSIEVQIIDTPESGHALDFDLSDDSPTAENPALDADLLEGSGLGGTEKPGMADFGFAETTDLDLEITEAAAREPEDEETDMIPPPSRETSSILESEVLPEETGYDMSVIMDVTKMPAPEEATERDLMAVRVDDDEPTLNEENYTLSKEVDYRILEQDYEEELTATQALNVQIEEAARELAADLGEAVTVESETLAGDETAALDLGSPAAGEQVAALDDTSLDDGLTINLDSLDETGVNKELGIDFDVGESTAFNEALTENLDALGDTGISEALQEELVAADDTGINEALTESLDAADATGIDEALTERLDAVDATDIDDELTISLDPNDKTATLQRSSANEDFDDKTVEMEAESGKKTDFRAG
jgi:LPXTG-motif cell wall-anchored protein